MRRLTRWSPACGCKTDNELSENSVNLGDDGTVDNVSSDSNLDETPLC